MKQIFINSMRPILKLISIILLFSTMISCSKQVVIDEIDFQRHLVGGTGSFQNTFKVWKLDSLAIDGKAFPLTVNQKKYTKKFYHSGAYIDSDGYSGKWDIKNNNELITLFKNNITSTFVESKWLIKDITSTKLIYQITNTDNSKYDFYFKISYE